MSSSLDCDIFCRVIDNYGDIGVCWRLARQLHTAQGWQVRLWVDDLATATALTQDAIPPGIALRAWPEPFPELVPAQVVIEAFACELPDSYLAAMAARTPQPVWLNLEYLCVEDWGPGFHLQPSPHPRLPLCKHFFVPGILPGTGGLLRERALLQQCAQFDVAQARAAHAGPEVDTGGRWTFLFCYDNPALPLLLDCWADAPTPTHCLVAAGKANAQVEAWLGRPLAASACVQRGALHLHALPFVAQTEFDALLWTCDLNFVRGEDSFVRAQWAGRPCVWQAYPQQDAAHHAKLDGFLRHYAAPPPAATALADFSRLWNGVDAVDAAGLRRAWQGLEAALPVLAAHAGVWQTQLTQLGELSAGLAEFCKKQLAAPAQA